MVFGKIAVSGNEARILESGVLTSGTVGASVEVTFDGRWDGFEKIFLWQSAGKTWADRECTGVIPAQALASPGERLLLGFCGRDESRVLPTVWVDLGIVTAGAGPEADPVPEQMLPLWAQVLEELEAIKEQGGSAGPPGPKGDKGDKGDRGDQGPRGITFTPEVDDDGYLSWSNDGDLPNTPAVCLKGPKGDKGDRGEPGAKGDKGDTGPQGPKGDTGIQGAQGPKGDTGPAGADGAKGDQGDKGDTGATGPQGPKGDTGATGPQGPKGDTGETGPQGPKGDTGPAYALTSTDKTAIAAAVKASLTTENWTFTLEDGSSVTKAVLLG